MPGSGDAIVLDAAMELEAGGGALGIPGHGAGPWRHERGRTGDEIEATAQIQVVGIPEVPVVDPDPGVKTVLRHVAHRETVGDLLDLQSVDLRFGQHAGEHQGDAPVAAAQIQDPTRAGPGGCPCPRTEDVVGGGPVAPCPLPEVELTGELDPRQLSRILLAHRRSAIAFLVCAISLSL